MVLVLVGVALAALALLDLLNLDHPTLDPVEHMASFLVHGRAGWLLVVFALVAALAVFLLAARLPRRRIPVVVMGVGLVVAGLVPTQPYGQWDFTAATLVHGVAGWVVFVAGPVAAWRLRRDVPPWPGLVATVSLALLAVAQIDLMGDGPDHVGHIGGLVERLLLVAELAWVALAARAVGTREGA